MIIPTNRKDFLAKKDEYIDFLKIQNSWYQQGCFAFSRTRYKIGSDSLLALKTIN